MLLPGFKHWVFRPNFRGEFLYMYGSQEKIWGQKVNVKFFTVDPYSVGTGVPRPFSKFANYWKNIFLKIKTSKIKSEKNIYQTIHNTRFIFNFFGIFTIFLYFLPTCHKGLHDHLRSVMSMHFWRFFSLF